MADEKTLDAARAELERAERAAQNEREIQATEGAIGPAAELNERRRAALDGRIDLHRKEVAKMEEALRLAQEAKDIAVRTEGKIEVVGEKVDGFDKVVTAIQKTSQHSGTVAWTGAGIALLGVIASILLALFGGG